MNPAIANHILILQDYMEAQKELINLIENQPTNEFELNSYVVKTSEIENRFEQLSEELRESVEEIAKVK